MASLSLREFVAAGNADRKAKGLATVDHTNRIEPGAVFILKDEKNAAAILPGPRGAPRRFHPETGRRAIIFQSHELGGDDSLHSVLIVPCSASRGGSVGPWDFQIPDGEPGFTKERVVAYTSLVQPMMKADLIEHVGNVSPGTLGVLVGKVARNLGFTFRDLGIARPR